MCLARVRAHACSREHGFLLDVDGSYTTVDVPGAFGTTAFRIKDSAEIVGQYVVGTRSHGFLARPVP
jgi:hypothetical protein